MISIKSENEIQIMRRGGKLLAKILADLAKKTIAGKTPLDLETQAEKLFNQYGAIPAFKGYRGYPNICCISTNHEVVHGIPNSNIFKNGDLVKIDCGLTLEGLNTDAAVSVIVGGEIAGSEKTKLLNQTTKKALNKAIHLVKPGTKLGDIGHIIQQIVETAGLTIIRDLMGHGIGYDVHEDPPIFNFGKKGTGIALKPGMTIAIEPIVCAGERFIKTLENRWTIITKDNSLACQWEHTVLVTNHGHEILTAHDPF